MSWQLSAVENRVLQPLPLDILHLVGKFQTLTNSSGNICYEMWTFFFHFFNLRKIYWNIVNLKCFKYAAKWFSYTFIYMCIYRQLFSFFSIIDYYKDIKYSPLFSTVGPCCLSILYLYSSFISYFTLKCGLFNQVFFRIWESVHF